MPSMPRRSRLLSLLVIVAMPFLLMRYIFFFEAEDGIRDLTVTGVQTCALPISRRLQLGAVGGGQVEQVAAGRRRPHDRGAEPLGPLVADLVAAAADARADPGHQRRRLGAVLAGERLHRTRRHARRRAPPPGVDQRQRAADGV